MYTHNIWSFPPEIINNKLGLQLLIAPACSVKLQYKGKDIEFTLFYLCHNKDKSQAN